MALHIAKQQLRRLSRRLFPLNTKVRIVSAYEKIPLITTEGLLGVSQEFYVESDRLALKAAEDTIENTAKFLRKKNFHVNYYNCCY